MKEKLGRLKEINYIQIWGICNANSGGTLYKVYRESEKFGIEINYINQFQVMQYNFTFWKLMDKNLSCGFAQKHIIYLMSWSSA